MPPTACLTLNQGPFSWNPQKASCLPKCTSQGLGDGSLNGSPSRDAGPSPTCSDSRSHRYVQRAGPQPRSDHSAPSRANSYTENWNIPPLPQRPQRCVRNPDLGEPWEGAGNLMRSTFSLKGTCGCFNAFSQKVPFGEKLSSAERGPQAAAPHVEGPSGLLCHLFPRWARR